MTPARLLSWTDLSPNSLLNVRDIEKLLEGESVNGLKDEARYEKEQVTEPYLPAKRHVAVDTCKDNKSTSGRLAFPISDQGEQKYLTSGWTEALDYE